MVNRIRVHSVVDHWSVRSLAGYRTVRNRRTKLLNFLFRLNSVSSRLFLQSEGSHANLSSSALINRSTFLTMRNYTTYELFFSLLSLFFPTPPLLLLLLSTLFSTLPRRYIHDKATRWRRQHCSNNWRIYQRMKTPTTFSQTGSHLRSSRLSLVRPSINFTFSLLS